MSILVKGELKKMDYKKYLTENVLKFWLDNAIDDEFGGIFTCLLYAHKRRKI